MKRILSVLLVLSLFVLLFTGCTKVPNKPDFEDATLPESTTEAPVDTTIKVEITKNVVGMGAVYLMRSIDNETSSGNYTYTQVDKASEDFTFAILPTEEAYSLVKNSNGKFKFVAVAAKNNITFIELNERASSAITDLKDNGGKFYVGEEGSLADRVLKFLFTNNGLTLGSDITFSYQYDEDTLSSLVAKGRVRHCALTEPYATSSITDTEEARSTIDISSLWEQTVINTNYLGSEICSACIVVNAEFAENNPTAVTKFLREYNSSAKNVASQETASELVVKYGYLESTDDIAGIIARSNFACVKGTNLKSVLGGFLSAIYGEEIPDTYFYLI